MQLRTSMPRHCTVVSIGANQTMEAINDQAYLQSVAGHPAPVLA
jgi:hypothetical protein